MKFRSKVDWWFWLIAVVLTAMPLAGLALWLIQGSDWGVFVLAIGAVDLLLILPTAFSTYYTFEESCLYIKCGVLFYKRVPYESVYTFGKCRNPLSSAAPSLDRVEIRFKRRSGSPDSVLVSPLDRDGFIEELQRRTGRLPVPSGQSSMEKSSKVAVTASSIISAVVIVLLVAMIFFAEINVELGETSLVAKTFLGGSAEVGYADIDSVELRENFSTGRRSVGVGSGKISAGSWVNDEFGSYKLYSYNGVGEYIVILHDEAALVVNLKGKAETQALYAELLEKLE